MLAAWCASLAILSSQAGVAPARDLSRLTVLRGGYPRAFFFRACEGGPSRRNASFEQWDATFGRLMGIMGKCLDEEVLGRERNNPAFFARFKRAHPEQVVLLHFNGNARDPRYKAARYFPGHWIYRRAVMIRSDVPAATGETDIEVESVAGFRVNTGRYRTSNDDVALFGVAPDGTHDWDHCEQVRLVSVDAKRTMIRVRRAQYGTRARSFRAGRARAAPHRTEGPWGKRNNLMWYYNYATHCPRDANGRTCSDLLVDDLATWFGRGGALGAFDGLEFDVLFNRTSGDTDGDGREDGGVVDGVNNYGIGVYEFLAKLRARMGERFIIQADGALGPGGVRSQRGAGLINGIESEGFPDLREWDMDDWSGGLNRHAYWSRSARAPAFSYVNHKYTEPVTGKPGVTRHPDVGYSIHRLVFAACCFTDSAVCYSFPPPKDADGRMGVWDELRRGADGVVGWLGAPRGAAVHLAERTPDLLAGRGRSRALAASIRGALTARPRAAYVEVTPRATGSDATRFRIEGVPCDGPDLFVSVRMGCAPRPGYPDGMPRFARVGVSGGMIDLMARSPLAVLMRARGGEEVPVDRSAGAAFAKRPASIAGVRKTAYFVHPPYRGGAGYTSWTVEAEVPPGSALAYSVGMGAKSPQRSDGVWFRVEAARVVDGKPGTYRRIDEVSTKEHRWIERRASLEAFAGATVRLALVADCGPADDTTTDHAYWADARIVDRDAPPNAITAQKWYMTWVDGRVGKSTFAFRDVRSKRVDVSFDVEGAAPVHLASITVHDHPDAMYRAFEKGIVLANPSRQAYTFDLRALAPGRRFRRLRATANQDTKTNDGTRVGGRVELRPLDALFLHAQP